MPGVLNVTCSCRRVIRREHSAWRALLAIDRTKGPALAPVLEMLPDKFEGSGIETILGVFKLRRGLDVEGKDGLDVGCWDRAAPVACVPGDEAADRRCSFRQFQRGKFLGDEIAS